MSNFIFILRTVCIVDDVGSSFPVQDRRVGGACTWCVKCKCSTARDYPDPRVPHAGITMLALALLVHMQYCTGCSGHPPRSCWRAQYDELKAKKESIEKSLEEKASEEDKKRKAQEKLSLKSKKKAKATLSFDADEEEG